MFPIIRIPCQWQKSILFILKCLHSHSDVILHMSHWGTFVGGAIFSHLQAEVMGSWWDFLRKSANWEILHNTTEIWNSVRWKACLILTDSLLVLPDPQINKERKRKAGMASSRAGMFSFRRDFPLTLPRWQIFTTGFNQQAPADSNVNEGLHF